MCSLVLLLLVFVFHFKSFYSMVLYKSLYVFIKRPARDACLCMGELQAPPAPPAPAAPPAPPAPHFVFLITL